MAQAVLDLFSSSLGSCLGCFAGAPTLQINHRRFKILRLLGEGGFSYVYLVTDTATAELFALKKIRCPFGAESVAQALREVDAYARFAHSPCIIHSLDHAVAAEPAAAADPHTATTVYILLPYYRRGSLQDAINANLVHGTRFPERRLVRLLLGVCRALRDMHHYRPPLPAAAAAAQLRRERMAVPPAAPPTGATASTDPGPGAGPDDEYEADQERPLMADERAPVAGAGEGESYAHRDIKPGNIMISDSGTDPVLMDLGSVAASPLAITTRSQAIATQDTAAEHSTMPYRAPELFDVKTGAVIDTKVDIWSLGCTLYACLVGKSPFELRSDETGGSLSICVLSGDWRFPDEEAGPGGRRRAAKGKAPAPGRSRRVGGEEAEEEEEAEGAAAGGISQPVRELVRSCLKVEPSERPDIDELIRMVERVLDQLPEEDGAA